MSTVSERAAVTVPLGELAESWMIALEASGKSAATLKAYSRGVGGFLAWHAAQGSAEPVLDRPAVAGYLADLRRAGQSPGTIRLRYSALKLFSRWLYEEGETGRDELAKMTQPKNVPAAVDSLSDAEIVAMLAACRGNGFADRRDTALIMVMSAAGLRANEAIGLTVDDVNLRAGELIVTRGKGGKSRRVGFGPNLARALDRYMRERRRHPMAGTTDALWLPVTGRRTFGYQGLAQTLRQRAKAAGVAGFHPHRLRHSFASRWLAAGGSENALMHAAGWSDRNMINRYSSDTAQRRAVAEAARLHLDQF